MAAWRRVALGLFPELQYDIVRPDRSYYELFMSLRSLLEASCPAGDQATIGRIFSFGRWCLQQERRAPDLWNAAITVFYEHIFEACLDVDLLLPHLNAEDVANFWELWRYFTPPQVWGNVEEHLRVAFPDATDASGPLRWTSDRSSME